MPMGTRYRIRFAKRGLLRWVSHRDMIRLWERMMRRIDVQLAMSEGFHPKPKMTYPSAIALGVIGWFEVIEVELAVPIDAGQFHQRLLADGQPGLTLHSVAEVPASLGKAQLVSTTYRVPLPTEWHASIAPAIESLRAAGSFDWKRDEQTVQATLNTYVRDLEWRDGAVWMTFPASTQAIPRPQDILIALGLSELLDDGLLIHRQHVEVAPALPSDIPCDDMLVESAGSS
jgi:radical SAM-linked protein